MPSNTEERLTEFTELLATAIANAQSRDNLRLLADEQAALHRVAALVAHSASPAEVFAAVSEEVARLLKLPYIEMVRYDGDIGVVIGGSGDHPFPVGSRWPLDSISVMAAVHSSGQPQRFDDYTSLQGRIAEAARGGGCTSAIGAPIFVEGATWGVIIAISTGPAPIPAGAEQRLAAFTELVAAAISNLEAREEVQGLANEQTALRRLAMLVAREASAAEIFGAVTEEAARVVGVEAVGMLRFERDGDAAILVAQSETPWDPPPLGTRLTLEGDNVLSRVFDTGHTCRVDDWSASTGSVTALADSLGVRSSVATPIIVNGRIWGTLIAVTSQGEPVPAETEERIASFSELVAIAVANAESRGSLSQLAREQAALRRVATLIAEGAKQETMFAAVAEEVTNVLDVALSAVVRYETDATATQVGAWGVENPFPVGTSWKLDERSVSALVAVTGLPARVRDYAEVPGEISSTLTRDVGIHSAVGAPILVDGDLWGVMMALSTEEQPLPDDAETGLAAFTELIATAISNATARSELLESRARIVAAGDEARRRIERDLHDGTQQRLVSLALAARAASDEPAAPTSDFKRSSRASRPASAPPSKSYKSSRGAFTRPYSPTPA